MSAGDLLVVLSVLPFAVAVASMFNRRGALMEWSGSAAAFRAVRVRGTSFLLAVLMLGAGLHLGLRQDGRLAAGVVAGIGVVALVLFAAYPARTVADEPGTARRHQVARVRLTRASRRGWTVVFGVGCLAALVLVVLAFG